MVSFLNKIIMAKFFIQKIQLSEKEIINGVEHWGDFEVGKGNENLKISTDKGRIVMTYTVNSVVKVLMTIPDSEEFRVLRGLVEAGYESALVCYFCEVGKDKNFMKNPPKVAVFLKSISQGKEGKLKECFSV